MSSPEPSTPAQTRPRRSRVVLLVAGVTLGALVITAGGAWISRRALARDALVGWLDARGVPAAVEVERFGPTGFVGKIRVGPEGAPEVTAERVEVGYGLQGFWSGDPLGVQVTSVRLVRPVVRGAWRNGELSFGSLDPIIEEFRRRPPRPEAAKPLIVVEDGLIRLASDYGEASVTGGARIADGKLMQLDARVLPATLKSGSTRLTLGDGRVRLITRGDRIDFALQAELHEVADPSGWIKGGNIRISGQGPYPDLERRRGDGRLALTWRADAVDARLEDQSLHDAAFEGRFTGRTQGWIESFAITGVAAGDLTAERASFGGAAAQDVTLDLRAPLLSWSHARDHQVLSRFDGVLEARDASGGDLRLRTVSGSFQGEGLLKSGEEPSFNVAADLQGRGSWAGLGPLSRDDDATIAALKRAASDFTLRAPAVSAELADKALWVRAAQPIRVSSASGATAVLAPRGRRPVFGAGEGTFDVAVRGGGLPSADVAVERLTVRPDGFVARATGKAQGDFALFQGATLSVDGDLSSKRGVLAFVNRGCVPVTAQRLELGENDVERASAQLCPDGRPLLTVKDGAWRVQAKLEDADADAPFLEMRFADGAGRLDAGGKGGALKLDGTVDAVRIVDTARETRFRPIRARGQAGAENGRWSGRFALADGQGRALGEARLRHVDATGEGAFDIDTGELVFAEGGLQPAELSPLMERLGSPATGRAHFIGGFAWGPQGERSGGTLDIPTLDFKSPAGAVAGLKTRLQLTSLAPLATAQGQVVVADRLETVTELTDVRAEFTLTQDSLQIADARAAAGGGVVRLEPVAMPLVPTTPWNGALTLENVQLSDVVERSPFADKVDFDARVSGRLPFSSGAQGVKIAGGELHAVQPGRLSIDRAALIGVSAGGGGPAAEEAPNTITDFAYQAMENLAFDELSAQINSLPAGRLGVVFHIKGEHSPPQRQEIRLSYLELARRKFLDKPLPLPSGTKVNLTLDTTVNLDQLLRDYDDYMRARAARGSQPVQP